MRLVNYLLHTSQRYSDMMSTIYWSVTIFSYVPAQDSMGGSCPGFTGIVPGRFDRQKSRGTLRLAPVRRGVCGACHLKMPLGHLAELRDKQDDHALCDNCGTYIFLAPDEISQI